MLICYKVMCWYPWRQVSSSLKLLSTGDDVSFTEQPTCISSLKLLVIYSLSIDVLFQVLYIFMFICRFMYTWYRPKGLSVFFGWSKLQTFGNTCDQSQKKLFYSFLRRLLLNWILFALHAIVYTLLYGKC